MNYKALAYLVLIIFLVISSLFFFFNASGKNRKNKFISGKWSLLVGVILLVISVFAGIDFLHRVYEKMKSTVVSLKNFPETVDTENSNDTTNFVRALKKYEPEKYKGNVPDQYYSYYGFRDWWRFPLVYPYAIYCIELPDKGGIVNDSGRTNFEEGSTIKISSAEFDSLTFDANYFAAKIISEKNKSGMSSQYFLLDFSNGKKENFNSIETLYKRLDELNFSGSRKFISVKDYSENF